MKQRVPSLYIKTLRYILGAILVVAPFYLTLSIWLYQFVNHLDFLKIWEELALTVVAFATVGFLVAHKNLTVRLLKSRLVILVLVYLLFILAVGVYDLASGRVGRNAIIYGWLTDLRPVAVFLLMLFTISISRREGLKAFPWRKVLMIPAVLVIAFGFLQATVLHKDFLSHFGYSPTTTPPYETVDNQPNLVRVQSTTRGPNPFGAYIMLIDVFLLGWFLIEPRIKNRIYILAFGLISLFTLYHTYSRSAELGLIISLIVLGGLKLKKDILARYLAALLIAAAVVIVALAVALSHHNYLTQNVLFHTSNRSTSAQSSNAQRASAERQAVSDIYHNPLGTGVGSAGPASRRNTKGPTRIAENFFLQIGQELGIIGLVLFAAINAWIGYALWRLRQFELPSSLLAGLVGLTLANMFYHAWADETLAYVFWGLAGIALAPILTDRLTVKNGEKTKTAT